MTIPTRDELIERVRAMTGTADGLPARVSLLLDQEGRIADLLDSEIRRAVAEELETLRAWSCRPGAIETTFEIERRLRELRQSEIGSSKPTAVPHGAQGDPATRQSADETRAAVGLSPGARLAALRAEQLKPMPPPAVLGPNHADGCKGSLAYYSGDGYDRVRVCQCGAEDHEPTRRETTEPNTAPPTTEDSQRRV